MFKMQFQEELIFHLNNKLFFPKIILRNYALKIFDFLNILIFKQRYAN